VYELGFPARSLTLAVLKRAYADPPKRSRTPANPASIRIPYGPSHGHPPSPEEVRRPTRNQRMMPYGVVEATDVAPVPRFLCISMILPSANLAVVYS